MTTRHGASYVYVVLRSAVLFVLAGASCTRGGSGFLQDRAFRRAALLASLPVRQNDYAALRLARYASGDALDWDRRPEWNPPAEPLAPGAAASAPASAAAQPLPIPAAALAGEPAALRALGEAAFFRYPAQLTPYAARVVASTQELDRYGFWRDAGRAGGLLRVALADGSSELALSCATCHARLVGERLLIGAGNERLDLGALIHDTDDRFEQPVRDAAATWGRGRIDVTTTTGDEPASIPDLRPVHWASHLQHDATVRQHDVYSLAIRIETLLITSHGGTVRPPHVVALGLAVYLDSLAQELPQRAPQTAAEQRGANVFVRRCQGCHAPPGYTGRPVALEVIGTDPALGRSLSRGTGTYRVPSLRGVGTRGALLHDATLPDVQALLAPARLQPDYRSRLGNGPVRGHGYGLDLDPEARADLIAFLHTL
jgi:hypothetical protein